MGTTLEGVLRRQGFPVKISKLKSIFICASVLLGYIFILGSNAYANCSARKIAGPIFDNNSSTKNNHEKINYSAEKILVPRQSQKPKIILYWNKYFGRDDFIQGQGNEIFVQGGCRVTNCFTTHDRRFLNETDALMLNVIEYNSSDVPSNRSPHQRYVFYLFETLPFGRDLPFFHLDNYFNWTMTHRRDSDIYVAEPYGALRRKNTSEMPQQLPEYLAPNTRPKAPSSLMKIKDYPQLAKKKKMVAWFCSNTVTQGKREDYIHELAKHVSVDIYGKCGTLECLSRNSDHCNNLLDEYKFYISAENSLCADYISEKFYRALSTDVIPIVYGGADYAAYAPPHSFITVADFETPKDLADYLLLLSKNKALYMEYFAWKKNYDVVRTPLNGWCDLCEKLNDESLPPKTHANLAKWWFDDVPCYDGNSFINSFTNMTV